MRFRGLWLVLLLFVSACVMRPDAEHNLVARTGRDGEYYLVSVAPPKNESVPKSEMTVEKLNHNRMSTHAIEAYIRSQIKWIGGEAEFNFRVGNERLVKSHGEYFVMVDVDFFQPRNRRHSNCDQALSVMVSTTGLPVGVYAGDLATCDA